MIDIHNNYLSISANIVNILITFYIKMNTFNKYFTF